MAKIKYSALVSDMRNKLNGSVMSKNRYGSYIRNKVTPTNPQTQFQQNQRSILSSVSASWRGLSAGVRQAFANLAEEHPFTDIFGDAKKLDGKAMFSKLNMALIGAGSPALTTPKPFVDVPFVSISASSVLVANGLDITLDVDDLPLGYKAILSATPPLSPTINFVKNRFRQIGVATVNSGSIEAKVLYDARLGAITAADVGKRVFSRIHLVNTTTGQVSLASESVAVVTVA